MPIAYSTGLAYRLWGLHDGCNKDTFLLQQRHILALSNHSFMLHPLEGLLVSVQVQLNICNKRIKQLICPNRGYMHLHWLGRSPKNWRHRLTVTDFNPSIFHQLGRSPKITNEPIIYFTNHQPTWLKCLLFQVISISSSTFLNISQLHDYSIQEKNSYIPSSPHIYNHCLVGTVKKLLLLSHRTFLHDWNKDSSVACCQPSWQLRKSVAM